VLGCSTYLLDHLILVLLLLLIVLLAAWKQQHLRLLQHAASAVVAVGLAAPDLAPPSRP
jgi:hypothetical protein